jgi:hypothetical protein
MMGIPVLILGESGSGKSTSLRNFDPNEIGVFNVGGKPLPFRKKMKVINGATYNTIMKEFQKPNFKKYVIDDAQFLMSDQYFDNINTSDNFGLFKSIGCNFRGLIKFVIDQMPNDVIVYFLQHVEMSPTGIIKAKTMGKLLDEKDTIEGRCAIVLLCKSEKSKHFFVTQSEGVSTAKSPMDMFDSLEIDNDLKMVDQTIREYWNLNEKENA